MNFGGILAIVGIGLALYAIIGSIPPIIKIIKHKKENKKK